MYIAIRVLSEVRYLSDLLAGAQVDGVEIAKQYAHSQVTVRLRRPQIEVESDPNAKKVPVVNSRITLRGISDVRIQPGLPSGQAALLNCEAVPGGYAFTINAAGQQTLLRMPSLDGDFEDQQ